MPDPFPKYETQGSKKLFIFRIPRFNNTVLIDPTANMDGVSVPLVETVVVMVMEVMAVEVMAVEMVATTGPPNGSAPMFLLNVFASVFPLLAAITLFVF